jgi:hypothetical protein
MATTSRTISEPIDQPTDPTDPTWCPTCLSGTAPRDPYYEVAIEPDPAVG